MSEKTLKCRENVGNQKQHKKEHLRKEAQNEVYLKKKENTSQQIERGKKRSTQNNKTSNIQSNNLHRI